MQQQNEKIIERSGLSAKRQALLDRWLEGKIPVDYKVKSIPKREVFSPVPVSYAQKRLWVLDRLVPDNPSYNSPAAIRLKGALDLTVFERSINELIRRHESLRTIFKMENEEPVQVILPEFHARVNVLDLSHLSASEKEKETHRFIAEEAARPFDLERGPLLRVYLLVHAVDTHILMYNMHHIITDGRSIELFKKEWLLIYEAFSSGKPSPLPEPSIQYADFAIWQQGWLKGEALQKQLSYWKNILGGDIPILELPADRQRPAVSSYCGQKQMIEMPGNLAVRLAQLSREAGCTMFMTMLAAFSLLLYRYSGQEDILFGTPLASRTKPELEDIIGFFANTLVIRINLAGSPTFHQLLQRVRRITTGAYDNQDLPYEQLVEELQPDRYMNHNPLFQVMMVLENMSKQTGAPAGKNIEISSLPAYSGTSKFDLWLLIIQSEKLIHCELEYSTDLFDSDRITRLLCHFKNLLEAVAAEPGQPIDHIRYVSDAEKEQLLYLWNDTAKEYVIQPLHYMFRAQVEKTPDHIAVIDSPVHISYTQLNERSGRLALKLREKGIKLAAIAGIKVERSVEMVVGLMGILKAGAAYLPIDPQLPPDRMEYMLKDSSAKVLLAAPENQVKVKAEVEESFRQPPQLPLQLINIETELASAFESSLSTLTLTSTSTCQVGCANLAYVIYTSGSTGKPKGVMVKHEGISNRLHWMQDAYGLTTDDRILQKTPYNFDVSVWEFFWTLSFGAALIMAKPGGHKDSAYLVNTINREKITTIHFVPTMLNVFLEDPGINTIRWLKRVICSGETLAVEYQEKFFKRFTPGVELHNLYGPTEASVDVTHWTCQRNSSPHSVPIGRPIANTQLYILDRNLNIVPIGIPGELHIAGVQLARGYLNNPELTYQKFLRSFFQKATPRRVAEGKLYRTGDLACWLPDGTIEFIGRLDFQVKVRGFRIELGEIEANLRDNHSVSDAVVLVRENSSADYGKKLVTYVVPNPRYWKDGRQKETASEDLFIQQVKDWQDIFNDTYAHTNDNHQDNPTFNTAGWNSSYTGAPIPAEEMRLWVDNTIQRILSYKPQNVMEIGCGTGLFLFRIIPHCRRFLGTDIAQEGLNYIDSQLETIKETGWADVQTKQCSADNFDGIEAGELDMIILNSVIQYFPTVDYLEEVLEKASQKIKPGGHIFIGDVRSLPLLKTFHASVELSKAEPGVDKETILRRISNKISLENELVIDPCFFDTLKKRNPRIKHVEPLIKYGRYHNELSKFRYDVILHIGAEDKELPLIQPDLVLDWNKEKPGIQDIKDILSGWTNMGNEPDCAIITSVPNARIQEDIRALKRLTGMDEPGNTRGIEPNDFLDLEIDYPYHISLPVSTLPGEEGFFNAVFTHQRFQAKAPGAVVRQVLTSHPLRKTSNGNSHANNPLLVRIAGSLVPQLRDFLKERLPEYMVPSHFVLLERLPMTTNGKLDRRGLPEPVQVEQTKEFVEPSTKTEKMLAQIWQEILNLEQVSVNQNFFQLGGDSVNAIQVVSRARKQGVEISIQLLFRNQTIAELAGAVKKSQHQFIRVDEKTYDEFMKSLDMDAILEQVPAGLEIEDIYPASPLQLHQVDFLETRDAKNTPTFLFQKWDFPLEMTLDVDVLEKVLQIVSERYPVLRTVIIWKNLPEPVQVVCKKLKPDLYYNDLTSIPAEKKIPEFYQLLKQSWNKIYNRNNSSPMRLGVCKLNKNLIQFYFMGDFMRMDGWSTTEFAREILSFYGILKAGAQIPNTAPQANCYKEYVHTLSTLRKQKENPAEGYWRSVYKDFSAMKSLTSIPGNQTGQATGFAVSHFYLSPQITARMEQFLMEQRLSLSPFIQGTWAALLGIYLQQDRIVYGMVTTGRSIPIAGIEHMTGHSINILPMLVPIPKKKPLLDYFRDIQDLQTEWTRHEHTQVDQIYEWLDLSGQYPLFDHYLVIQNLDSATGEIRGQKRDKASWKRKSELLFSKMDYPLRIDVFSGYEYCFVFHYYLLSFTTPALRGLMDNFKALIETIIENPHQTFEEWTKLVDTDKYKLYKNESPDGFVQEER